MKRKILAMSLVATAAGWASQGVFYGVMAGVGTAAICYATIYWAVTHLMPREY